MQFIKSIFTSLTFLAFLIDLSLGFGLPSINDVISAFNKTAIAQPHSRDVVCLLGNAHDPKFCSVFTVYYKDGTGFEACFDSQCHVMDVANNPPDTSTLMTGRKDDVTVRKFLLSILPPIITYQGKNYGVADRSGNSYHCENGKNGDTGHYCLSKFLC